MRAQTVIRIKVIIFTVRARAGNIHTQTHTYFANHCATHRVLYKIRPGESGATGSGCGV